MLDLNLSWEMLGIFEKKLTTLFFPPQPKMAYKNRKVGWESHFILHGTKPKSKRRHEYVQDFWDEVSNFFVTTRWRHVGKKNDKPGDGCIFF
jgi:hypothetical protein